MAGDGYPGSTVFCNSAHGDAYISNQRVVYVSTVPPSLLATAPGQPPPPPATLTAPIMQVRDAKFEQPWFKANRFTASILPTPGGGLPDIGRLTLIFNEGGGFEFMEMFRNVTDRIAIHNEFPEQPEDLPAYPGPPSASTEAAATATTATTTTNDNDDLPAYDTLSGRLDVSDTKRRP